ncbi:MAG: sporulation protein YtfJ [Clostridiales bacterium]|nr:sporulation protein YtfJ [Clostridiales bacterium]
MSESKINDIIQVSLEKIRELVDAQTIIGNPINTANGTTVIPVSKVTVGFASGGLDYNSKKADNKSPGSTSSRPANFGGGGGTGISVSPIAFLIVSADGNVDLLTINKNEGNDPIDKITALIERSPDILEKFKTVFSKNKKNDQNEQDEQTKADNS